MAKKKKSDGNVVLNWSSKDKVLSNDTSPSEASFNKKEVVLANNLQNKFYPNTTKNQKNFKNRIIKGDNLEVIQLLLNSGLREQVKLIYIDPPFLSQAYYSHSVRIKEKNLKIRRRAYHDKWSTSEYLDMLYSRLILMKELLKSDGTIFLHSDWHASSRIQILLDEVFGEENFLNEIIWNYGGRGAKAISGQFPRNHDTIYVYGKSKEAKLKKIYTQKILTPKEARKIGIKIDADGNYFKTAPRGDYTDKSIKELEQDGRIYRTRTGKIRIKYPLQKVGGNIIEEKLIGDVWSDVPDAMHISEQEKTGYGTQKPIKLLRRIIESATDDGDLVLDLFSGSGTTAVAAERLKRRWILSELGETAVYVTKKRLITEKFSPFTIEELITDSKEKKVTKKTADIKVKLSIKEVDGNSGINFLLTLKITGFKLRKSSLESAVEADKKNSELLFSLSKEAPAALIDLWSVDWDYDGEVFCSSWHSVKNIKEDSIEREDKKRKEALIVCDEATIRVEKKPKKIALRIVDILGDENEVIISVK
ncbi:MAG: site-specific DNA-methyltransferase [Deltaproteobacteria bacterium]|nr:site-specific DNA-methyltransferase [Deltaproteobacteria bacterium]